MPRMNPGPVADLLKDGWRLAGLVITALVLLFASVPLSHLLHEPDVATFGMFASFVLGGAAAAHVCRRLLFPSIGLSRLAAKAAQDPRGAGMVFVGVCLVLAAIILAMRPVQAAELPPQAHLYLPLLQAEQRASWPDMSMPSVLAAQVEQETCASLSSPKCWNPRAELKTPREYGFGLGQCTVTAAFNCQAEARQLPGLEGWSWAKRYDPQLQLRALVLKDLQGYRRNKDGATERDRLAFALSCYNGGCGGVAADRKTCRATPGCDSSRWFGHVEHTSYKTRIAVKGYGRSFFAINREYVRNVLMVRRPRYVQAMGDV